MLVDDLDVLIVKVGLIGLLYLMVEVCIVDEDGYDIDDVFWLLDMVNWLIWFWWLVCLDCWLVFWNWNRFLICWNYLILECLCVWIVWFVLLDWVCCWWYRLLVLIVCWVWNLVDFILFVLFVVLRNNGWCLMWDWWFVLVLLLDWIFLKLGLFFWSGLVCVL